MRYCSILVVALLVFIIRLQAQQTTFDVFYGMNKRNGYILHEQQYSRSIEFDSFFFTGVFSLRPQRNGFSNLLQLDKTTGKVITKKLIGDSTTFNKVENPRVFIKKSESEIIGLGGTYLIHDKDTIYMPKLFKINAITLDTIWTRSYKQKYTNSFLERDLICTSDNGFLMSIRIHNFNSKTLEDSNYDFWFIKTDESGEIEWEKKIGESNINEGDAKLIEVANGYILTGYKYKVGSSSLYGYVQKIDKAGNTIWQKNFEPNIFFNYFLGITSLQDGGYLLCGGTWEGVGCTDNQCSRARLVKVDSTGKTVWDKRYFPGYSETGIAFNGFYDCQELTDGNIILVGSTSETQYNNDAGFLMKVTPKGDSLWCRIYDKNAWSGIDYWSGVTICRDGGFLCTGVALDTTGSSEGEWPIYKAWLVKTDSLGCWISGCSTDTPNEEIRTIEASVKIFPNPATDRLTIEVTLPHYEERTELVLCDITGKELMKTTLPDYAYIGYIDVSPLAAGMYILQLRQRGGVLKSEKVVVER